MKISHIFIILFVMISIFSLTSCVKEIPGEEQALTTSETQEQAVTPGSTSVMDQIYLFATQTAMASSSQTTQTSPTTADTGTETSPEATTSDENPPTAPAVTEEPTEADLPEATAIVVPTATPGLPSSYTLQGGEFPYCIARRFNVNPTELLQMNGLSSQSVYYSGMTLAIPQTGRTFPGQRSLRPHPTTYTVLSGDTIHKIACTFGDVDPNAIAFANGLEPPYNLTPGMVIHIP